MRFAANASLALIVLLAGMVGGMSAFNVDAIQDDELRVCKMSIAPESVCREDLHDYERDACDWDVEPEEKLLLLVNGHCCSVQCV